MAKKDSAKKLSLPKLSFNFDAAAVKDQFQGLNGQHPGLWPALPKFALLLGLVALLCIGAYFALWSSQLEAIENSRKQEADLKNQFRDKVAKAVNLPILLKQKEQVLQYVGQLEKQLPSKAEMDALLTDINNAGVGRGLQFELFKPNQVIVHDYYAELPIQIKLAGSYHDFGSFTSDISNLSRIVTLNDMKIDAIERTGGLMLEATAKTFRYLDAAEILQRRKEKDDAAKKAGAQK
jgi:type IV pilus assembly protein PilO